MSLIGRSKREAAPFAVHAVLTRRERHVPSRSAPRLPNREADQLQAIERTVGEVQLRIGELSRRVALSFGVNFTVIFVVAICSSFAAYRGSARPEEPVRAWRKRGRCYRRPEPLALA